MGYIAALFIGVSLGLIGGGGSILTVPVLVYLFGLSPVVATSYSLFIVGITSFIGAANSYRKDMIDFKTTIHFGITSVVTVFIVRKLLIHRIPEIISIGNLSIPFAVLTMVLFALLMIAAAISMMMRSVEDNKHDTGKHTGVLLLYGIGIGLVTGFLGAGGGFLLIPALVLLLHLPMKKAVGTSLLIIAINSLIGFAGDIGHLAINWNFLLVISAIAITGVITGGAFSRKIHGDKLKKGFGIFILILGIFIILKETDLI